MNKLVTFQSLVVMLLLAIVLELGVIAMKLPIPTTQAASPMPVYIVDGPFGLYTWVKVHGSSLQVENQ